ncbi:MAG: QueT transporter family protein [Synergistaceae bacterium]|nr:QueT transporter family protein [Synergistaceae bacterium]
MKKINFISKAALIATFYISLTLLLSPFSFGIMQLRFSEALCILAFFFPEAILGLFIGCLLSNIIAGCGFLDIILGSLATLLSSYLSYKTNNIFLASFYVIFINAICVGSIVAYVAGLPMWIGFISIFISEAIATLCLGIPLGKFLHLVKHK